jgi:hypothetical protein
MTRTTTRRHPATARLIPAVLPLTLLAAACGGEQGQGTQPAPASTPATATSADVTPGVASGEH